MSAQSSPQRSLRLQLGPQQMTLLDLQATPVIHNGPGLGLQLDFSRETESSIWHYQLGAGMLSFRAADEAVRFGELFLSGTFAHFGLSHLRQLGASEKWSWHAGGMLRQMATIDFSGIGYFPWIFAQGGLYAKGHIRYQLAQTHRLSGSLALPLMSWITDMPYNQIPRVEGRAPDVISALRSGTRLASWNSFQQAVVELDYAWQLAPKWSLSAQYQGSWMHDAVPADMWAYRNALFLGASYQW